jgi:hypothetical protein
MSVYSANVVYRAAETKEEDVVVVEEEGEIGRKTKKKQRNPLMLFID